jgi:hypothetical protein
VFEDAATRNERHPVRIDEPKVTHEIPQIRQTPSIERRGARMPKVESLIAGRHDERATETVGHEVAAGVPEIGVRVARARLDHDSLGWHAAGQQPLLHLQGFVDWSCGGVNVPSRHEDQRSASGRVVFERELQAANRNRMDLEKGLDSIEGRVARNHDSVISCRACGPERPDEGLGGGVLGGRLSPRFPLGLERGSLLGRW